MMNNNYFLYLPVFSIRKVQCLLFYNLTNSIAGYHLWITILNADWFTEHLQASLMSEYISHSEQRLPGVIEGKLWPVFADRISVIQQISGVDMFYILHNCIDKNCTQKYYLSTSMAIAKAVRFFEQL